MLQKYEATLEYAQNEDKSDKLNGFRSCFLIPKHEHSDAIYFCGNSLGLQPVSVKSYLEQELNDWAKFGVEGHFRAKNPWFSYHHLFSEKLARIVGANTNEVVAMNTLTVNLHLLMLSFYRPTSKRYKIIMEAGAFPSDRYAIASQVRMHGLNPDETIIEIEPNPGEFLIDDDAIIEAINKAGDDLALVIFGGANYYTGQFFDLERITKAAHGVGAYCGFDLAHAVGNLPLQLHDWQVDFACWCTYKYLNAGPGSVGGAFVHERQSDNPEIFRLTGWWGNDEGSRFKMAKNFIPMKGAASWQMSNAPVFNMVGLLASLNTFDGAGMEVLREKSVKLTGYMEFLLQQLNSTDFQIITPKIEKKRGCQLSLLFSKNGRETFKKLEENGIIADWREPDVIRIAPVPLYNTFEDCYRFFEIMK